MDIVHQEAVTAAFAAEELKKFLVAIVRPDPASIRIIAVKDITEKPVTANDDLTVLIGDPSWCEAITGIHTDPGGFRYDGFHLGITEKKIVISGLLGRSLLFGVYSLLKEAGCRWFYPGELGTFLPRAEKVDWEEREHFYNPDFEIRGMSEGTTKEPLEIWTGEVFELTDWMGKSGCNALSYHGLLTEVPANWAMVVAEAKKRGFIVEIGGHGVQDFVPRELFEMKPELFRVKDGIRVNTGNFCASNDESTVYVADRIKKILEGFGDVDILHLCFDDVTGGSWCDCEECREHGAISQMYSVVDRVWKQIRVDHPDMAVDMVLYHDTLDADKIDMKIDPEIIGTVGLRERCYSHPIDDPSCAINRFYNSKLEETVRAFGDMTYVFDYYDDLILFLKMKVNCPVVIAGDLKRYKSLGINKITSLEFGRYSWWAYEFNMTVYAALTWDTSLDWNAILADMCDKLYPANPDTMRHFYKKLEEASFHLLTFCGYRYGGDECCDIRTLMADSAEFSEFHAEGIRKAGEIFWECLMLLDALEPAKSFLEEERIRHQKLILLISVMVARATFRDFSVRILHAKGGGDPAKMNAMIDEAMTIESEMEEWIKGIPFYIKGVAGGKAFFEKHLCNDTFRVYRRTRRVINAL